MTLPWSLDFIPDGGGPLQVTATFDEATDLLEVRLTNSGDTLAEPHEVRLRASMDTPAASGFAWLHGRYMQTDALVRVFAEPLAEGYDGRSLRDSADGRTYISRELLALSLPVKASPALVIGSLRMDRFFLDIEVELNADESTITSVSLVFDVAGVQIGPGETLDLPPVLIRDGRDLLGMVEEYADEVAARMSARVPVHVPTGWCSWYYFYDRVTEADILANLATMRATNHPAEYVQIDDGYQSFTGDWLTANAKFPSGMGSLALTIREAGYKPGIWLAPFVMHEDSAVLRDHPEMALKLHDGTTLFVETWLGRCAVIDFTNPASETWLREVVRTVVHDWGYAYLKLDALVYAARSATHARYCVPGTTAADNLRRGLEIIREAAGEETFILGCTCHFGPAIGLVDAMRVGPDVKETWEAGPNPSVRHAMRMTLQRNWMHGRWWVNDPDCLIVREENTELDEAETRFLATSIALSGGMVVASDDLPKLSDDRRTMALALFPSVAVAARPFDPGEGPVPSAWRADLGEGRFLIGILNWTDAPRWVARDELLRPGEVAFDVWNQRLLGMGDPLLRPHEGLLWQVAARGPTPRVVGDSASLTYGHLTLRPVSGRIQVTNDLERPRVLAIEARGRAFEVELGPGEKRWFD